MLATTAEGADLARILLDLLIILAVAKFAAEVAERLRVPAVLGEIVAGIAIGDSVIGLIDLEGPRGVSIAVLAEIGVLLLLVQVGMEMDLAELGAVGRTSLVVAVIGVALPFAGGALAGLAMGESGKTSVFLGAALTATSVGITARVFGDLRALSSTEARIVIGAAVADDVLGLVILTVVVKVVTGGNVGFGTVAGTLGLAVAFLVATGVIGLLFLPRLLDAINRRASSGATTVVAALVLVLTFAELADAAKLAFIIGAFMAGLSISRSKQHDRIAGDLGAIGNILVPVFFVQIGLNADLGAMAKPSVLTLAAVLTAIGVAGKIATGLGALGTNADKLLIGLGMIPRGEVGLIFASIGLANGVLDSDLYGALLVVVLVTTIVTPPLLRMRIGVGPRSAATASDAEVALIEPVHGWVAIVGDSIQLSVTPSVVSTVAVALRTANLLDVARPSDELLEWFAEHRATEIDWEPSDTPALLKVLRQGDVRVWRFLEVTGVLERALPELASSMHRRRADMRDLDPVGAMHFPVVEALQAMREQDFDDDETVTLAALSFDVAGDEAPAEQIALELATRLGRASIADRVANLVADAHLLRSAAGRQTSFDELALLQLAAHLASPSHARQAYALALAEGALTGRQRHALDELYGLVRDALDHPDVTGPGAADLAGARRLAAQRLVTDDNVRERLAHASMSYLLAHDPDELARQAQLVEPLPWPGTVRVAVSPAPDPDTWKVDVACHDSAGLLAHLTTALTNAGLTVSFASISTWADGAVLDSFIVRATDRPAARALAQLIEASIRLPLRPQAMPQLEVSFDSASVPWYTVCAVSGPDDPDALAASAIAFARAKVVIHAARVSARDGQMNHWFTVSDRLGRKLDGAAERAIRDALHGGKIPRRLRLRTPGRRVGRD